MHDWKFGGNFERSTLLVNAAIFTNFLKNLPTNKYWKSVHCSQSYVPITNRRYVIAYNECGPYTISVCVVTVQLTI